MLREYGVTRRKTSSASAVPSVYPPAASVSGGIYIGTQSVLLLSATANARIYYTTDGSTPTTTSTLYTDPFPVSNTLTIRAFATKLGSSSVVTEFSAVINNGPLMVVAFGESNSGGTANNSDALSSELAPRTEVSMFNVATSTFEPLDIGTNNNMDHAGLNSSTHGWELELANNVASGMFGSTPIYYVQTGQGASLIAQWHVGGTYWTKFLSRIAAAKSLITGESYAVWISLGINDALASSPLSATAYRAGIEEILTRIKAQLPGARIFLCKLPSVNAIYDSYSSQIDLISAVDPDVTAIDVSGLPMKDTNHWSYVGMKLLSDRIGAATISAFGIAQSNPSAPQSIPWAGINNGSIYGDTLTYLGIGSAISNQVGALEPFTLTIVLNATNGGIVTAIGESASNINWGSGTDPYVVGVYHYQGVLYRSTGNGQFTTIATGITLPLFCRISRSGNDALIETSASGNSGTWTTINTRVNAFLSAAPPNNPIVNLYVKSISAVSAGAITVTKS